MQKSSREKGLKRFWSTVKSSNSSTSCEQGLSESPPEEIKTTNNTLPLLQVWPSSDSPRGEADGQSFVFPECAEDATSLHSVCENNNNQHDSGIDSTQISPSPLACGSVTSPMPSPTSSFRRPSSTLLHPDHARLLRLHPLSLSSQSSVEDVCDSQNGYGISASSSTSSLASIAAVVTSLGSRSSDPCDSRRRSSNISARYSLFDALDLEYALLRAAARGSVGPYSLSESLHKLTFTQSLAFPALARGLASKNTIQNSQRRPRNRTESNLNAFAKIITALVLVLISILVFAVVYKFVKS